MAGGESRTSVAVAQSAVSDIGVWHWLKPEPGPGLPSLPLLVARQRMRRVEVGWASGGTWETWTAAVVVTVRAEADGLWAVC